MPAGDAAAGEHASGTPRLGTQRRGIRPLLHDTQVSGLRHKCKAEIHPTWALWAEDRARAVAEAAASAGRALLAAPPVRLVGSFFTSMFDPKL